LGSNNWIYLIIFYCDGLQQHYRFFRNESQQTLTDTLGMSGADQELCVAQKD